jgi:hypothetical protein
VIAGFKSSDVYGQLFPIVGISPGGKIRANFGDQPFKWSDNQIDEPFELFDNQIHDWNSLSINTAEEGEEGFW